MKVISKVNSTFDVLQPCIPAPNFQGRAVLISGSVGPRPPRLRGRAPCLENKNSAPQARFCGRNASKQAGFHAFWPPKQQYNQPQPPRPPH